MAASRNSQSRLSLLGEATMGAIAVIAFLVCLAASDSTRPQTQTETQQPAREGRAADANLLAQKEEW